MKPGIYDGCPDTDYHSAPGVSSSILKEMGRSPAHCRAKRDGDRDKRTKALDTGIILHCAVLEPERFAGSMPCRRCGSTTPMRWRQWRK